VGIAIEADGIVTARYSNGQSKPAGQLELANFRNPQGLQPLGGNAWARTYASGDPILSTPGQGNMGVLQAGALEESNVDLTAELVNMITAQRTYQANAQTIKTQDQVMQTLVNLR
jgi:flagellar hook protein FlgE